MPRDGNLRWRYGKKLFLFNLIVILGGVILTVIGSYFYPDLNNWYFNTLVLVVPIGSIAYWVHTARQFSASFRDRFIASLTGSSVYWALTVGFFMYAVLCHNFAGAAIGGIIGVVMGVAAVVCMLVVSLVKKLR